MEVTLSDKTNGLVQLFTEVSLSGPSAAPEGNSSKNKSK
jgi:hypothetical protein